MTREHDEGLLPITKEDRQLWKFILDAPYATCSRIDNLPDDTPELQEIARHRLEALASTQPAPLLDEEGLVEAVANVLWSGLDLNGHTLEGVRRVARAALSASRSHIEREVIERCAKVADAEIEDRRADQKKDPMDNYLRGQLNAALRIAGAIRNLKGEVDG